MWARLAQINSTNPHKTLKKNKADSFISIELLKNNSSE